MQGLIVDPEPAEWDRELAKLGGHPWQSAHWAEAERAVDGMPSHRLWLKRGDRTIQMARVEVRTKFGIRLAWMRRGPTGQPGNTSDQLAPPIAEWLGKRGYSLAVASPWRRSSGEACARPAQTIWIDLSPGRDRLWSERDTGLRNAVRRASRDKLEVAMTREMADIHAFTDLLQRVSAMKGFEMRTSAPLMSALLGSATTDACEAQLFVAKVAGELAAGAFIARCGPSVHYVWGATDRRFSRQRAAEVLQWSAMEWALEKGCSCYDLGGIDPVGNPGTYVFKRRLGGEEITLVPTHVEALNLVGKALQPLAARIMNGDLRGLAWLGRRKTAPSSQIPIDGKA
jgi:hypothetical protein